MTSLKVTVWGERETRVMVEGFGQRAAAAQSAMEDVADHLRSVHAKAFAVGGVNLPKPWKPLRPSTRERKRKEGWSMATLIRRGDLRDSLTKTGAKYSRVRVQPTGLEFGTRSPVARLLRSRRGGSRNPVQLPSDTREITRILERHIAGES